MLYLGNVEKVKWILHGLYTQYVTQQVRGQTLQHFQQNLNRFHGKNHLIYSRGRKYCTLTPGIHLLDKYNFKLQDSGDEKSQKKKKKKAKRQRKLNPITSFF